MRLLATLSFLLLALAACGREDAGVAGTPETEDLRETATPIEGPAGAFIKGPLGGDAQLEGGCAWVEAEDARYEVLWPDGYEVQFDPLRLVGPDGEVVAEEGDVLRVYGAPDEERVSVCQVGPLWNAQKVEQGTEQP